MTTALESLLPAAHCALPQKNRIDGLVSGPGCSSVLWLISGDPDRYPGSVSDQSSSICGQLPAEVLANQSSSGSAMTSQVLFLCSVFTGNQDQDKKRVKGTMFFSSFFQFSSSVWFYFFFWQKFYLMSRGWAAILWREVEKHDWKNSQNHFMMVAAGPFLSIDPLWIRAPSIQSHTTALWEKWTDRGMRFCPSWLKTFVFTLLWDYFSGVKTYSTQVLFPCFASPVFLR